MKRLLVLTLICFVLTGSSLAQELCEGCEGSVGEDHNSHEVITTRIVSCTGFDSPLAGGAVTVRGKGRALPVKAGLQDAGACRLTTFENGDNSAGIHGGGEIPGSNMAFPGWLTIIDSDAGGTGNFANEPSPETIAFFCGNLAGCPAGSALTQSILFTNPVSEVSLYYASFPAVSIEAYDATNTLVDSEFAPGNWNSGRGGDPTGFFDQWDPVTVSAAGDTIVKVTVAGNTNQTGIDSVENCAMDGSGAELTDLDLLAPPVIQVVFAPNNGDAPTDVTDDALPAGMGTDGNQFEYNIEEGHWQYNLKTDDYTAAGTYTISIESGDPDEYELDSSCEAQFVRQ